MQKKYIPVSDVQNFRKNSYTKLEAERVLHSLQHHDQDYNAALSDSMDEAWHESETYVDSDSLNATASREEAYSLLKRIDKSPAIALRMVKIGLSIAASVLILMTTGLGIYHYALRPSQDLITIQTDYGETQNIVFADGTSVMLNACSKISYPKQFDEHERQISLEGEAYFQVVKNEKAPFIVSTGKFEITVLGTEFNVKAYDADKIQTVDVKSGKVQVETADARIRLIENEQLRMDLSSGELNKHGEQQEVAVWRHGALCYDKTPLRDVANELERNYNCQIRFRNSETLNNLISGEHNNKSLDNVLQSIERISNIHFRYIDKNIIELYK